ncbi:Hypothetical protein PHPALM_18650 [Phytophthora palmivora]|uniref:Uncharacterized protein n=1 Tax=Phytophthora palmivora TaxID=4796 RepID=A0A2P4XJ69_9STRA|nr:Hypothetical protein PHPALM_18650 [Phytophthora palmivora]
MTRDHDSAGRLLRVLGDCELFHMEAAIESLRHVKSGIRSESLLKPSGNYVNVLECTSEGRVLSLSDHKRIARLQALLTAIVNAYDVQGKVETDEEVAFSRNLISTVAGAAMMQSIRDCTSSRTNCCIWSPKAEKLHVLLDWMMSRENAAVIFTHDYFHQLMLDWIQPMAEKQNQLAACLTLFELLQRHRHKLTMLTSESKNACVLVTLVGLYLDALRAVVERGVVQTTDSHRVKPSKLALIALETLALLCSDVAARACDSF